MDGWMDGLDGWNEWDGMDGWMSVDTSSPFLSYPFLSAHLTIHLCKITNPECY